MDAKPAAPPHSPASPLPQVVAVIPARGGSKGVTRKNIRVVAGKPLLAYTIAAARQARCVSRVIVSTDDAEIAQVARDHGAEVPFQRPAELAQDNSPGNLVMIHAMQWLLENQGVNPAFGVYLQPTSPLRDGSDIDRAAELAAQRDADSVISVSEVRDHPWLMKRLDPAGLMSDYTPPDTHFSLRQNRETLYVLNGALYLIRNTLLLQKHTFYSDKTYGLVIPPQRGLEIDTEWDLHLMELLLRDAQGRS